jgi:hypothetical protein
MASDDELDSLGSPFPWDLLLEDDDLLEDPFERKDDNEKVEPVASLVETPAVVVEELSWRQRWESFINNPAADRKDFLLHVPFAIQDYVNAGDLESLRSLMDRLCSPNCTLRTRVLSESRDGREKFIEIFASRLRSVPDYCFIVKSSLYSPRHRMLTFDGISTGTRAFEDSSAYIYDTVHFGGRQVIDENLRIAAMRIQRSGRMFNYSADIQIRFQLNEDLMVTKIVKSTNVTRVDVST